MLYRTIECIKRTLAAALNPLENRFSAPGMTVAVKKLAVSNTRLADFEIRQGACHSHRQGRVLIHESRDERTPNSEGRYGSNWNAFLPGSLLNQIQIDPIWVLPPSSE